jgi:hypothetical protein
VFESSPWHQEREEHQMALREKVMTNTLAYYLKDPNLQKLIMLRSITDSETIISFNPIKKSV